MIKPVIAALAALSLSPLAAFAGPYVNVENNAGWTGSDYDGATTDLHVGFNGELGDSASWYAQGGPSIVSVDGEDSETELSGKIGASIALTDELSAYGEISAATVDGEIFGDDFGVGTKIGATYSFW